MRVFEDRWNLSTLSRTRFFLFLYTQCWLFVLEDLLEQLVGMRRARKPIHSQQQLEIARRLSR